MNHPKHMRQLKKFKAWFRKIYERKQNYWRDILQDTIYNEMRDFCWNVHYWEFSMKQKGKVVVRKYHILLRGSTVDTIVKLTRLKDKMDMIKNKLRKTINNRFTNESKLEICLNLEDDLKFVVIILKFCGDFFTII
jgi:hypothetical protein